MLLNHKRQRVRDWDEGEESLCPDCELQLIPKRGEIISWHWAHKSNPENCTHEESDWHLTWKSVYSHFADWEIEVPLVIDGNRYRIDAMNSRTGAIREFVHSISQTYRDKHLTLKEAGFADILWVWDGKQFVSNSVKVMRTRHDNWMYFHLLKPSAALNHAKIGGLVHYKSTMVRNWKAGVWFDVLTQRCSRLCQMYEVENESRSDLVLKSMDFEDTDETQGVFQQTGDALPESAGTGSDSGIPEEIGTLEDKSRTS